MQRAEFVWMDGGLVPWDEARVHVLSHSLHYGSAVFEGLRAYATPRGPAVLRLDAHVERLLRSAKVVSLDVPYDGAALEAAVLETIRANGHASCYVRPLVFRGLGPLGLLPKGNPVHVSIATWDWGTLHGDAALTEGVDVGFSSWRRMAPGTHPAMAKASGNYLNSLLVVLEAQRHGYAEGLVLDVDGYLSEGGGENVFLVRDGAISTPPLANSILPGITRGMTIVLAREAGYEVREERLPREAIDFADEVFMTGTAAEITPVRSVDGKPVGDGAPGPVTRELQRAFFAIVRGETDDRHEWLTHLERTNR